MLSSSRLACCLVPEHPGHMKLGLYGDHALLMESLMLLSACIRHMISDRRVGKPVNKPEAPFSQMSALECLLMLAGAVQSGIYQHGNPIVYFTFYSMSDCIRIGLCAGRRITT